MEQGAFLPKVPPATYLNSQRPKLLEERAQIACGVEYTYLNMWNCGSPGNWDVDKFHDSTGYPGIIIKNPPYLRLYL